MQSAPVVDLFKVLMLNVAICILCLHFSSLLFELCSWFFEHWGQGCKLSRTRPFFSRAKSDAVNVCGLRVSHGYLSMAVFILIYRSHSYRWAAVVSPIELTILSVEPQDSYVQDQVMPCVWSSECLFAYLYVYHAASHVYVRKEKKWGGLFP